MVFEGIAPGVGNMFQLPIRRSVARIEVDENRPSFHPNGEIAPNKEVSMPSGGPETALADLGNPEVKNPQQSQRLLF